MTRNKYSPRVFLSYNSLMKDWTPRRIIVLVLGLWVALAPPVFVMTATAMTLHMSMSSGSGPGGCVGCPDTDADGGLCALMCLNAALAATTTAGGELSHISRNERWPVRHLAFAGHLSTPDPGPPKSVFLQ